MNFLKSMTIERMYVTLLLCQFNRVVLSVWLLRPLGWDPTQKAPSTWDRADGAQCWIWRGVRLQLGTGPIWGEEERYGSNHPHRRPSRTSLVISGPRSKILSLWDRMPAHPTSTQRPYLPSWRRICWKPRGRQGERPKIRRCLWR